jgi:hypothetical protein
LMVARTVVKDRDLDAHSRSEHRICVSRGVAVSRDALAGGPWL